MIRQLGKTGSLRLLIAGLSISLVACSDGNSDSEVSPAESIARATLLGADGTQYGEVIIGEGDGGLIVRVDARGLEPGPRGVHIHQVGKCDGPDFKSAGGHWNPTEKQHGFDNPKGAHMGDFVNLEIGEDGSGSIEATIEGGNLKEGANALMDSDGAAFVVHAGPDDMKTDPSGESGGRVACGIFELQKFEPVR
ncbi:superoxide dismutase family protein [Parasphingorhabdus cellanae]|uniref:Superoxide dismutase family protein n=1 Tax=Parasphingorhabdus cellanae TaxID=2806553 RepID=A0ABX7T7N9_9SPHN|nr:superoxide dismutase family protein [Parasphingorhabdus cellanae]QTD56797.1 superoxide dismutase family protein [Parasphingorhabdus cellanae]